MKVIREPKPKEYTYLGNLNKSDLFCFDSLEVFLRTDGGYVSLSGNEFQIDTQAEAQRKVEKLDGVLTIYE